MKSPYANLAHKRCQDCHGSGLSAPDTVCGCVYRLMFKECLARYHSHRSRQASLKSRTMSEIRGVLYSRPSEDYMVDFELVCQRAIAKQGDHRSLTLIFKKCFLSGVVNEVNPTTGVKNDMADWTDKKVAAQLGLSPESMQRYKAMLSRILGQALHDTRPYPLYPLKHYFGVGIERKRGDWKKV